MLLRLQAAAAVVVALHACARRRLWRLQVQAAAANTSGGGSPNSPEDSGAYVEVNLLSVWSVSILPSLSKHFPILHTPCTVSIRIPAAADQLF